MSLTEHRGQRITVSYDSERCTHAGQCVRNLPAVFNAKNDPWIDPDGATVEKIIQTVQGCPSGALQYRIED